MTSTDSGPAKTPAVDPPLDERARQRIRDAALTFVQDAFLRLEAARALPLVGQESPWLEHTRIRNVLGHDAGAGLTAALESELPVRFQRLSLLPSAKDYAIGLLRGVVANVTVEGLYPLRAQPDLMDLVEELLQLVDTWDQTIRSIRLLTDIDVSEVAGSMVAGVRLEPVRDLQQTLSRELKEAVTAVDRIHVSLWSREPRALAITEVTDARDAWQLALNVRPRLHYVATALRLLTGATISQSVEVYGQPTMVHATDPMAFEVDPESGTLWRRIGALQPADLAGLRGLVEILERLDKRPPRELPSLVVAIGRFNRAHRPAGWQDLVVDLAIGVEAALAAPGEREDLTLALRSRAAHLLASPEDPTPEIFKHVGELFKLRGSVVHGSIVPESEWTRIFAKRGINQVLVGDRLAITMDRWRDLLRRALLARLLLSGVSVSSDGPWPLRGGKGSIDGQLVGAAGRHEWRVLMRKRARELGISRALLPAEPLRDLLHDRWGDDLSN